LSLSLSWACIPLSTCHHCQGKFFLPGIIVCGTLALAIYPNQGSNQITARDSRVFESLITFLCQGVGGEDIQISVCFYSFLLV
jgi:hypothetical protein